MDELGLLQKISFLPSIFLSIFLNPFSSLVTSNNSALFVPWTLSLHSSLIIAEIS